MGQQPPRTAGAIEIQKRVKNFGHLCLTGSPARFGQRQQGFEEQPLILGQVSGIRRKQGQAKTRKCAAAPRKSSFRMIPEFEHLRRKVIEEAENAVPKLDEAISSFRRILKR
jgi:hypothetical protein